jgi:hypothetical protein
MSGDYDFGFSFADAEEAATTATQTTTQPVATTDDLKVLQDKIDGVLTQQSQYIEAFYKAKLKEVEGLILPLLYNLMKNPDKAYIKWENRVPIIQAQIDKITSITRDV